MIELIALLVMTHTTIICVTLYLHRGQAHKGMIFHPIISHLMRFWLWFTTGMITKQWVAVHRKHHRFSDKDGDPHSPLVYGIVNVLFRGAWLYNTASKDHSMVNSYGVGTPDDWIERNLYSKYSALGILLLLIVNLFCFAWWGLFIWAIQMIWIPFWAAGVVNGLAHWWGYKNGKTHDNSRNLVPVDMFVGGELLHNNHHLDPANAKFSRRWFEFDIGWMYFCVLRFFKLASLRHDVV